jgi:hypothetical protein
MATYNYSEIMKADGRSMTVEEYSRMLDLAKRYMSGDAGAADLVQKIKKAGEDLHREASGECFYDALVAGCTFYAKAHGLAYSPAFLAFLKTDEGRLLQSASYASRGLPIRSDWKAHETRQKFLREVEGPRIAGGSGFAAYKARVEALRKSGLTHSAAIAKIRSDEPEAYKAAFG